ncbi:(2Fe-2S)-binding protein [Streptomyces sp. CA-111067]|uniref:(2Fe-2S)-binding protein n=1 Tax=Streptomyces sp. CA-111067 TaxID=3240046 RepID=UPI003D97BD1F
MTAAGDIGSDGGPSGGGATGGGATVGGASGAADVVGPGAVIEEIAALGPFFAVRTHPVGEPPPLPWQPMGERQLGERVTAVREWLAAAGGQPTGSVELRVAASVAHLGLAARLVSPALAAAVLHRRPLACDVGDLRWQPVLGGPVPLSLPADALGAPRAQQNDEPGLLLGRLVDGPLAELARRFEQFGVSPHILLGNSASAVNGAATMIAATRPRLAPRTAEFTASLLARPPLSAQYGTAPDGGFRRRSCCLIYRAAPGGRGALCGDCALRAH